MGQLVKQHIIILITCAYPVFSLANLTLALVGTSIEKCDVDFLIQHCILYIYETTQLRLYKILKKVLPLVKPEESGD